MEMNRVGQWTVCLAVGVAAGLVLFAAHVCAGEQGPDQLRDQIQKLEPETKP